MVFIVRNEQPISRPDAEDKVIKAQEFWSYRKARQAVHEANAKSKQIIEDSVAAFEDEKRRGYKEGLEAARLEQTGNMIEIISQTVNYFAKVEAQMVDLVMDGMQKIVNGFDDNEKVVKVVRSSLALVRNQKQITVKVHPSQISNLNDSLKTLFEAYPGIEHIEVLGDSTLTLDACVIESDIGQVEASMSGQLQALQSTFERVFGSSRARNELSEKAFIPQKINEIEGTKQA